MSKSSERGQNAEQVVEDDMMGSSCWLLFLLKWKCCSSQSTIGMTHVVHFDIFTHLKLHAISNWASKTRINTVTNEIEDFPVDTHRNLFAYAVMRWYTNVFPFFVIQSPKISVYITAGSSNTLHSLNVFNHSRVSISKCWVLFFLISKSLHTSVGQTKCSHSRCVARRRRLCVWMWIKSIRCRKRVTCVIDTCRRRRHCYQNSNIILILSCEHRPKQQQFSIEGSSFLRFDSRASRLNLKRFRPSVDSQSFDKHNFH